MSKREVDELIELSKVAQRMTFKHKLKLMNEAAQLLRKNRPMKEVLDAADRVWRKAR